METDGEPITLGSKLAKIAERLTDKIAIVEGDRRLSYGELDASATAIAGHIAASGDDRPGFVCLLFQSKIEAIKAMLGASRCGRAYVSLDAGDPDERLRFILRDSAPIAVLTERALLERARILAQAGCDVIDIGDLAIANDARTLPTVSPDATAYVVYTSGSTGVPKGVCQTQRNLLFFANAYAKALAITESDRLSLVFSLSFGASNMNIFAGLLNGGTLCAYDMRREGIPGLAAWLDRERVSVLHTVPTVFRELMGSLAPGRVLAHLRAIDLAGEALFDSDVDLFRSHAPANGILVNQLGATEASVIAQYNVERETAPPSGRILPVGRSPEGVRVLIRRDDGSEADRNEVGEIVVRSAYVSPGYWRRPELDAATFSTDPLDPAIRRYFTRDLGRIDETGNLHFLGRKGSRVKIRGHSVDLTEVEAALCACPGVAKAAVLAASDEPQKEADRLIAYIAASKDSDRNPLRIRRRLAKALPSYMLPGAFLFMDALPLTSSGKIDRKALATIDPTIEPRETEMPRDDLERMIAGIFEELLESRSIGRDDDFFLLGGDSLSVVELQTRLREAFGVSLSNLYHDATVGGIAAAIRERRLHAKRGPRSMPILVPLREKGDKPPLFLIHGRLGQAFVSPQFLRLLGEDQPVWAFQARGLDGLAEPHATIEAIAADYASEMRKRRPHGPYFIGALCVGVFIANLIARSLREAGESVLPLLLFDPPDRPFEMDPARVTEQALLNRIRSKQAMGRISAPIDDPVYAQASVRTALAFEHAIRTHRPRPYDGPVLLISSRARVRTMDPMGLNRLFTGEVERFEVTTTHKQLLDVRNEVFASHLKHCLRLVEAAAAGCA
jgi:amino acid adenylation domain-containing protein